MGRYFVERDRERIAELLQLPRGPVAQTGVDYIEQVLSDSRRSEQQQKEFMRGLYPGRRGQGRPNKAAPLNPIFNAAILAGIFEGCTGRPPKHSARHPFYQLVRICLRCDPGKHIELALRNYYPLENFIAMRATVDGFFEAVEAAYKNRARFISVK